MIMGLLEWFRYMRKAKPPPKEEGRQSQTSAQFINIDNYVQQPWNYQLLSDYAEYHPCLRTIHEAKIKELIKNKWAAQPRWIKKCTLCGREYQTEVDECEVCGAKESEDPNAPPVLADPDPLQKNTFEAFLDSPNERDEMEAIVKSTHWDMDSVDDWYWSIKPDPWRIYVEDSRQMRICYDKYGRLGNGVWYCTKCWHAELQEQLYNEQQAIAADYACEFCGGELRETAYVNVIGGRIQRRFHKEEIIHSNSSPWLPRLYGSPKPVAILRQLRTITAMDVLRYFQYTKGQVDKLVILHETSQETANQIARQAKAQKNAAQFDQLTGGLVREPQSLILGSDVTKGATVVDLMQTSEQMQMLETYEKMWTIAGGVYGVSPIFLPGTEQTKTGYHQRMQIIVQNDSTLADQQEIEEPFNETLLPMMGISDWVFKFNPIETRDELGEANVWRAKVDAAVQAKKAGMDVELSEEGELKISIPDDWMLPEEKIPDGTRGFMVDRQSKPPPIPESETEKPFSTVKSEKPKAVYKVEVLEE